MSLRSRAGWVAAVLVVGAAALWWATGGFVGGRGSPPARVPVGADQGPLEGKPLPSLDGVTAWTGVPVTRDSLVRRVSVIGIVNLDLPPSPEAARALQSWHDAYTRYGLLVVAVQVPEFAFAAAPGALATAARRAGLTIPMALDASLEVWRGFGASGQPPRFVVADADGRVTRDRSGAAAMAEVEAEIRTLLQRQRPELRFPSSSSVHASLGTVHDPVHLGQARAAGGPLVGAVPGRAVSFTAQLRYQVEGQAYTPYPVGRWIPGADGVTSGRGGAENFVALRYDAGALGAVLGPPETGATRFWILHDERWLSPEEAGADVRFDGRGASFVEVGEAGLYALIRPTHGIHVVKLSPDSPGATIYAFTFDSIEPAPEAGH